MLTAIRRRLRFLHRGDTSNKSPFMLQDHLVRPRDEQPILGSLDGSDLPGYPGPGCDPDWWKKGPRFAEGTARLFTDLKEDGQTPMINTRWCNRCIVVVDSMALIRVQYVNGQGGMEYGHPDPGIMTNTPSLIKWLDEQPPGAVFELNQWRDAFHQITTWQGDPVCAIHLRIRVENERVWRR